MTHPTKARLAVSVVVLDFALVAGALLLQVLSRASIELTGNHTISLPDFVIAVTFVAAGGLIAIRRPDNAVGWILCASGSFSAISVFANAYSTYALLARPGSLPMGTLAAWISTWAWVPALGLLPVLFLLFPTGRPVSNRWRPVVWFALALPLATPVVLALQPFDEIAPYLPVKNPVAVEMSDFVAAALQISFLVSLFALLLSSLASIVVRFRRASGEERAQLKWFAYAGAWLLVCLATNLALFAGSDRGIGAVLPALGVAAIPASIGIAVLKYRLFDIDRIIDKTLVYGLVTAALLAGYAGGVLLLQSLLPLPDRSALAVAGSTLVMAALFRPLRGRIQALVDRRFHRARYDTVKTIEAFGASLRRETDLDHLADTLVEVVRRTVQPAHASVWLMETPGKTS